MSAKKVGALDVLRAIRDSAFPYRHRLVIIMLMSRARLRGEGWWEAWPSFDTMAQDTGLSRTSIVRCIRDLRRETIAFRVESGERKEGSKQKTVNTYLLNFDAIASMTKGTGKQKAAFRATEAGFTMKRRTPRPAKLRVKDGGKG